MKLSLHLALARIKKKRARNRRRDFDFGEVVPHVDSDSEPEHELELSDEHVSVLSNYYFSVEIIDGNSPKHLCCLQKKKAKTITFCSSIVAYISY